MVANATRRGTVVDTSAAATANNPPSGERAAKPRGAEHRLADDRAEADTAVHGDGEVRRRLGASIGRAEVDDQRHRRDEQGSFPGPGQPAQHEQGGQGVDEAVRRTGGGGESRPADHHGATAVADDELADQRADGDRHAGEDGDAQANAQLSTVQLVLDVSGHERHEHADVHEERERRRRHGEEGTRDEAGDALEPTGASRRRRRSVAASPAGR